MHATVRPWGFLVLAFLLVGCASGQAAVKFQRDGQNLTPGPPMEWTFDADPTGGLPAGAEAFSGTWAVQSEADAPSQPNGLCQTGFAEYPAITLSNDIYTDAVISTEFKPVSGKTDRAAGIIFRVQDKDNYYILRANALENNVNIYKYAGGQRSLVKDSSATVPAGQWQELRVEITGNRIRGYLNNQLVVEATDDTFQAGKIGLWTKSDSVTCFDNVNVTPQ